MTLTNGLVVMTPSSIAYSGTSASINADGSVVFSACTSLSLNGVFTGDYDNYMISVRHEDSVNDALNARLRSSGSDASATNYAWQILRGDGTTVDGLRFSTQSVYRIGSTFNNLRSGLVCYIYGPFLGQPTAFRSVSVEADSVGDNARIYDLTGTHSLSTSYDGLSLICGAGNFTGLLTVFAFNQ
jgi:hypothetical protein